MIQVDGLTFFFKMINLAIIWLEIGADETGSSRK